MTGFRGGGLGEAYAAYGAVGVGDAHAMETCHVRGESWNAKSGKRAKTAKEGQGGRCWDRRRRMLCGMGVVGHSGEAGQMC